MEKMIGSAADDPAWDFHYRDRSDGDALGWPAPPIGKDDAGRVLHAPIFGEASGSAAARSGADAVSSSSSDGPAAEPGDKPLGISTFAGTTHGSGHTKTVSTIQSWFRPNEVGSGQIHMVPVRPEPHEYEIMMTKPCHRRSAHTIWSSRTHRCSAQ